jgi:hypothetical protein
VTIKLISKLDAAIKLIKPRPKETKLPKRVAMYVDANNDQFFTDLVQSMLWLVFNVQKLFYF